MLLIGLTSEVDMPDWAAKGGHSMTRWISHTVYEKGKKHCGTSQTSTEKKHLIC